MLTNYLSYFLEEVNYPVHRIHQHSKHFILFTLILSILFMLIQVPFYKGQEYGYQYKNVMTKLKYLSMEKENSIDVMFLGDMLLIHSVFSMKMVLVPIIYVQISNGLSIQWLLQSICMRHKNQNLL